MGAAEAALIRMAKLFFFCGKMAAGKSTLAKRIAERENAILLVQDELLDTLFPNLIVNVASYLDYSGRINKMIAPQVAAILSRGVSVVLDFPANTRNQRAWFRAIIDSAVVDHELHFVDTPEPRTGLYPGMYDLLEEVMCRRRTAGDLAWNWNAGLASPPMPDKVSGCE